MNRNDLIMAFKRAGLGAHATALADLAAPAVRIAVNATESDALPLGASRIGGMPDVPSDLEWPTWRDNPLAFIAQLDMADVSCFAGADVLPGAGHLAFFYDARQPWGYERDDSGSSRVVYLPAGVRLTRREVPAALPDEGRFKTCAVSFAPRLTLPSIDSEPLEGMRLSDDQLEAYCDVRERFRESDGPGWSSQVLGHPDEVQGSMEAGCASIVGGTAPDWRLLLQVDSESSAGMMWGDVGRIYWWIRRADLASRRFDRAWLVLQCC